MYFTATILSLAVLAILIARLLQIGRRAPGLPPGPKTIPILGNLHLLPPRDIHRQFQKWAEEYGPVYSVVLGTKTVVVLSSAEAVRDLLDKKSAIYSDRQDHYLAQNILSGGNRMVMMHYGPTWRMIRKLAQTILNAQKSATYIPYQDLESKKMLFELLNQPERLLDSIRRYSMSVASSITYGFRTTSFDDPRQAELYHVVDTVTEVVQSATGNLLEVFPILRHLPDFLLPTQRLAREQNKREVKLFMGMWNNIKTEIQSGNSKPSLAVDMVRAQEKGLEGLTDNIAAYTAGTILEAGADTTSNTLYAWVQAMLLYPDVQRKAQRSIDEVLKSDRMPEASDYARLPYIRCCVKEATRWFPTAILGFPHAVMEDDNYMGYRIPKGTGIINNVYTIHMDASRSPDPHRFEPDRFQDDAQSLADAIINPEPSKRASFTFGAGRRICQGAHVAEVSLFLGISRILWAFDILPPKSDSGQDILPDPSRITQGFVCMPEQFKVILRPRSAERADLVRKTWAAARLELDPETEQWK